MDADCYVVNYLQGRFWKKELEFFVDTKEDRLRILREGLERHPFLFFAKWKGVWNLYSCCKNKKDRAESLTRRGTPLLFIEFICLLGNKKRLPILTAFLEFYAKAID